MKSAAILRLLTVLIAQHTCPQEAGPGLIGEGLSRLRFNDYDLKALPGGQRYRR